MRNDLMAEKIEIDPFGGRAAFGTAEKVSIEGPGLGKIAHGKREMEAWTGIHSDQFAKSAGQRSKVQA